MLSALAEFPTPEKMDVHPEVRGQDVAQVALEALLELQAELDIDNEYVHYYM